MLQSASVESFWAIQVVFGEWGAAEGKISSIHPIFRKSVLCSVVSVAMMRKAHVEQSEWVSDVSCVAFQYMPGFIAGYWAT